MKSFRCFCALAVLWTAGCGPSATAVEVTLRNEAGQPIRRAVIQAEKGAPVVREGLKKGASILLHVPVSGESSYALTVELADGKTLKGGAGYVEPGYKTTETVTEAGIVSKVEPAKY